MEAVLLDRKTHSLHEINLSSDFYFCPNRGPEKWELGIQVQALHQMNTSK